jgi:hypothetical protein
LESIHRGFGRFGFVIDTAVVGEVVGVVQWWRDKGIAAYHAKTDRCFEGVGTILHLASCHNINMYTRLADSGSFAI